MIDKPTHYKTYDTDDWHIAPASLLQGITNPALIISGKGKPFIINVPHSIISWKIFAFRWQNGDEWNSEEGMIKGELPR